MVVPTEREQEDYEAQELDFGPSLTRVELDYIMGILKKLKAEDSSLSGEDLASIGDSALVLSAGYRQNKSAGVSLKDALETSIREFRLKHPVPTSPRDGAASPDAQ